ncbi:ADP-ribosyltransferase [Aeromonas veronii]|uniref:ADP-ribosyltransferase n=1 Tax=Aeromonas veronii TaxID=654 RepID=UPI0014300E9D|nr:ADP-ribosyltransferase [Aeromonas veronii]NJI25348.1 ADP-ribosyltransferase [Aeromonas veronii]NJI29442.1 ADP-ribosyltransferase [Aeromonas veronii]NJI35799.1 ADP-ribosyltransferase [Aeromonas veronii]
MQIPVNTVGTQAVAHHSDATTGVGRMGQLEARQVATGQDATLLGNRSEQQKGQGQLSRSESRPARVLAAIKEWIGNLLGSGKSATAPKAQTATSPEDLQRLMKQTALTCSLGGFETASELNSINAEQLGKEHAQLVARDGGNGPLRALTTLLAAVANNSEQPQLRELAAGLLARPIAGIPLQQWGTVGGKVTELLASATPELLQEAMSELHTAMGEVTDLQRAVKAEIAGEPAQSATTTADATPIQSGESKEAAREQVAMVRQTSATGYKLALDLISYQASYLLRDQTSTEVTLSSSDLNALHQHIADGSINSSHMAKLQTRGDLQTLRTLALSLASGSDAKGSSLGHALDSLASARPNQRLVLGGLMQFASQGDQAWADHTAGKPEDRLDAGARQRFDGDNMKAAVARLGASEARQVLQQLEGAFGDRVKGICGLAVELVSPFADSETGPEAVLTSRLTRMGTVVSTLIDQIKEHLALPLSAHSDSSLIDSADQLTPLELAALAHIGVDDRYL